MTYISSEMEMLTLTKKWEKTLIMLWMEKTWNVYLTEKIKQTEYDTYRSTFAAKSFPFVDYLTSHNYLPKTPSTLDLHIMQPTNWIETKCSLFIVLKSTRTVILEYIVMDYSLYTVTDVHRRFCCLLLWNIYVNFEQNYPCWILIKYYSLYIFNECC